MMMEVVRNIGISDGTVRIDGTVDFTHSGESFNQFAKRVYKHYGIEYAKFFKMSQLSKLGFLASELLLNGPNPPHVAHEMLSVTIANASSSLHADIEYQRTVESMPSPAAFVYTLPNILIGEICIRHKIKGEGIFFIQERFEKEFIFDYVTSLLKSEKASMSISGWVDIDMNGCYIADLYLLRLDREIK